VISGVTDTLLVSVTAGVMRTTGATGGDDGVRVNSSNCVGVPTSCKGVAVATGSDVSVTTAKRTNGVTRVSALDLVHTLPSTPAATSAMTHSRTRHPSATPAPTITSSLWLGLDTVSN
jgi:hypothetical protein